MATDLPNDLIMSKGAQEIREIIDEANAIQKQIGSYLKDKNAISVCMALQHAADIATQSFLKEWQIARALINELQEIRESNEVKIDAPT